ncbi:EutN/CcmL family microcompartment protein [bacterium]|nr:EutN/CcmL family microcompartment protein [bacterium]
MQRAKVVGKLWLSSAHPYIEGYKILILCDTTSGEENYYLAVDSVDAGFDDEVLTVSGSASRQSGATKKSPADTAIIAIIDQEK